MSDFKVGDTIYHHFSTRAFATGIPTTLAGTPVAEAYEEASAVGMTAGVSLTIDHGETGHHLLTIVATGANSFETGKSYGVSLTAGTVDSVSVVGEVIFNFSLEKSPAAQDLANGTDGLGALKAETALIVADTNELQVDDVPGLISTLDAVVDTVKVDTAAILIDTMTTLQAELDAIQAAVITNATGIDIAADIIAIKAETALIVADTNELQTDDIPGTLAALNDIAAADVWAIDATGQQTQGTFGQAIGDPGVTAKSLWQATVSDAAGVSVSADVIAVKAETALIVADTNELQVDDVPGLIAALNDPTAGVIADQVWNEAQVDHVAVGSFGIIASEIAAIPTTAMRGTDSAALASVCTEVRLAELAAANLPADVDAILTDTGTTLQAELDAIQAAVITNATGVDIAADIIALKAETVLIVADTNELQVDDVPGLISTLDAVVDTVKVDTAAILIDTMTTLQAELDGIQADTENIQTRLPAALVGGRMDSDVEAINNDTDAADKLAAHALETLPVTFSAGGSTTTAVLNQVDGAAASALDDVYIGRILIFNIGTLNHQVTEITAYDGLTTTATITAVTTAPGAAHTARMV